MNLIKTLSVGLIVCILVVGAIIFDLEYNSEADAESNVSQTNSTIVASIESSNGESLVIKRHGASQSLHITNRYGEITQDISRENEYVLAAVWSGDDTKIVYSASEKLPGIQSEETQQIILFDVASKNSSIIATLDYEPILFQLNPENTYIAISTPDSILGASIESLEITKLIEYETFSEGTDIFYVPEIFWSDDGASFSFVEKKYVSGVPQRETHVIAVEDN